MVDAPIRGESTFSVLSNPDLGMEVGWMLGLAYSNLPIMDIGVGQATLKWAWSLGPKWRAGDGFEPKASMGVDKASPMDDSRALVLASPSSSISTSLVPWRALSPSISLALAQEEIASATRSSSSPMSILTSGAPSQLLVQVSTRAVVVPLLVVI